MNFKHKYLFLFPGLLVLIGILIFPVGFTVRLSMSSWDSFFPGLDYIGLENYFRLFQDDSRFWEAFGRLSFLSMTTVTLQYTLGFALALMVWKDIAFKRFFPAWERDDVNEMMTPAKLAMKRTVKGPTVSVLRKPFNALSAISNK